MAMQPLVLLVDDEHDLCKLMQTTLSRIGVKTHIAHHLQQAKYFFNEYHYQACITELHLPDGSGLELVQYIFEHFPQTPTAVLTAHASLEMTTKSLQAGAFECVTKPIHPQQLQQLVQKALQQSTVGIHEHPLQPEHKMLIGESIAIQQLRQVIHKIARSHAAVLIRGESGTGKEVVAQLIHQLSHRSAGPLVTINCGAIAQERIESELFGHQKDSFQGAHQDKQGLIQSAHGGSLFLDEVAELPLAIQAKLLKVIQDKKIKPIGSDQETTVDFRILSSSQQNLEQRVQQGLFRQDLFYRIHVIDIVVPPLRERGQDILILAHYFMDQICFDWNIRSKHLTKQAQVFLLSYDYAGNVRELRNMIERALILCDEQAIDILHLQSSMTSKALMEPRAEDNAVFNSTRPENHLFAQIPEEGLDQFLENLEREILLNTLNLTRWNRTLAAKKLRMSFRSLRYRLKKLGLEYEESEINQF